MATGFTPPRYEDIRAAVVAQWKLKFGANADTSSDVVDGLIIDIHTLFVQKNYDGIAEFYNQHNLGTATGLNIDAIIAPLFRILRLQATKSTSEIWVYGTAGTIIPALSGIATVDTGAAFQTTAIITIVAGSFAVFIFDELTVSTLITITIGAAATNVTTSGTASEVAADVVAAIFANANVSDAQFCGLQPDGRAIVFVEMTSTWAFSTTVGDAWSATAGFSEAVETGPVRASFGTMTRIAAGPSGGWEGVVNRVDATLGTRAESDGAYKTRHALAAQGRGKATPRALAQQLLALQGVTAVKIYQNTLGFPDNGRPSHSFEAVVDGGDQLLIAETIWLSHTTGTQSTGNISITVIDDQGLVAQPREILFSRPNYRYIHVQIVIVRGEGFPLLPLTDIQALVGQALETWGNALGIGRDVYLFEVGARVGALLSGIASVDVFLASTPTPLGSPSFSPADLLMDELDYSRWSATRVEVFIS